MAAYGAPVRDQRTLKHPRVRPAETEATEATATGKGARSNRAAPATRAGATGHRGFHGRGATSGGIAVAGVTHLARKMEKRLMAR